MVPRGMGVTAERMADEHRVGAIGIERPVGLVCDLDRGKRGTGLQLERPRLLEQHGPLRVHAADAADGHAVTSDLAAAKA